MVDRILEVIREKKLTPSQFADEIGIQRSGISHILSGRNKPSLEFVIKTLKRFPDIKPEWLLSGAGDLFTESDAAVQPSHENPAPERENTGQSTTFKQIPTLFDEAAEPQPVISAPKAARLAKKEQVERKIERIVVFYNDRSFREYAPED
jgi:transcriptional regulator with XRE-family HTH domain